MVYVDGDRINMHLDIDRGNLIAVNEIRVDLVAQCQRGNKFGNLVIL
jgi:hypothetical protein